MSQIDRLMLGRLTRLAPSDGASVDSASRVVRYTFSDESVGRDGHVVKATAWRTENFEANPVFLWQHLDEEPPIGKVFDLRTVGRALRGSVKYAETEMADSIYQLVKGGFLNATSTSWQPLEWDRMDSGGCVFTDVDLLEISQVGVPALATALAERNARRLNLTPIRRWAERTLDAGSCRLPRSDVEAIYRAVRAPMTRSDRRRIVREIQAKGDRMERAQRLQERIREEDAETADARFARHEAVRRGEAW
jgi:HK97 family phage prohead protease